MKILRLALLLAILLSVSAQVSNAEQNLLLGKWKMLDGPAGCYTGLAFASTTATLTINGKAGRPTEVTYNTGPTIAFVIGTGGVVKYAIADKNHISLASGYGVCHYQRE